jgi:hypothetical protein
MPLRRAMALALTMMSALATAACSRSKGTPADGGPPPPASSAIAAAAPSADAAPRPRRTPEEIASAANKAMQRMMNGRNRCFDSEPMPPHVVVTPLAPFKTPTSDIPPLDFTSDAGSFYVVAVSPRDGSIGDTVVIRVPKKLGTTQPVTRALRSRSPRLARDDEYLYVAELEEVVRYAFAAMPSGPGESIARIAGGAGAEAIRAHDGVVFWSDARDGAVWSRGRDGKVSRIEGPNGSAKGIALDDSHVYWASYGDGELRRAPIAGGASEKLARTSSYSEPWAIAVDDGDLFWMNRRSAEIQRVPKRGAASFVEVTKLRRPERGYVDGTIVVDGPFVYGIDRWDDVVFRVPRAGGSAEILALGQSLSTFGLDGDRLFWTSCNSLVSITKDAPARPWPPLDE